MPRRRRNAKTISVDVDAERGLVMRILRHRPKDVIAGALAFAAVSAIIANALFLQAGRHPAPMFGSLVSMPAVTAANPLPRPRPVVTDASQPEAKPAETKAADPLANLVKTTNAAPVLPVAVPRPPAPVPISSHADTTAISGAGSRRVAAVQRALTEYGYGQLKPTGTIGSDTQAAIQKFERARKLPATGQVSDRLLRELTATIGHPID
jgi:Putative peptidoglycan binding domain